MFKQLNGRLSLPKMIVPLSFLCSSIFSMAQDFPGYRAGNYTGVNGVFFNPANIADSRYRWDINLVSVNVLAGNNQASFKLKDLKKSLNADSLENQLYGKNAGSTNGQMSVNVVGPSLMFNVGKKTTIALTTRGRVMANMQEVDGKLFHQLLNGYEQDVELPDTISSSKNIRMSMNAWKEFGISVGRVLIDKNKHFLKGGITLKYLAGVANAYFQVKNFNTIINDDAIAHDIYLSNASGRIGIGFGGGLHLHDFEIDDLIAFDSKGFGADIGFVYEFRPANEANRRSDNYDWRKDLNKYKFRVGVALLDIGSIKYKQDITRSGSYDLGITGSERLYLSGLADEELDDYNQYFKNHPQYFTPVAGSADAS